jgi:hypothetical protein
VKIESFVPAAFIEDAFFRIATEKLFAMTGSPFLILAFDDAHFVEQRDERVFSFIGAGM